MVSRCEAINADEWNVCHFADEKLSSSSLFPSLSPSVSPTESPTVTPTVTPTTISFSPTLSPTVYPSELNDIDNTDENITSPSGEGGSVNDFVDDPLQSEAKAIVDIPIIDDNQKGLQRWGMIAIAAVGGTFMLGALIAGTTTGRRM